MIDQSSSPERSETASGSPDASPSKRSIIESVHFAPQGARGLTRCCKRTPDSLRDGDKMTRNPARVTCVMWRGGE